MNVQIFSRKTAGVYRQGPVQGCPAKLIIPPENGENTFHSDSSDPACMRSISDSKPIGIQA
jgi:hypothetical protein